jgi:hypothetical protein|tara:strand:- start:33 stop:1175 length:1143 start_codon:yes stop_codon:yes gene_type:complete
MPHLLREYAKNLGVKISKPIVSNHFFPIEFDNYITISIDDENQSKSYKNYDIVFFILKPFLKKYDIKVVQISGKSQISGVDKFLNIPFKQQAYVISNGLLHFGVDGALNHLSSLRKKPTVTLFGNIYANINKPLFSSSSLNMNLEPDWDKNPCFSNVDPKQQINNIKPEKIAQSIINLLKKEKAKVNFKTIYQGSAFNQTIIEVVPSSFCNIQTSNNQEIFIRVDYGFDQQAFTEFCKRHKCTIFTDKVIKAEDIAPLSSNINNMFFFVHPDDDLIPDKYFNDLKSLNINPVILVNEKEHLSAVRNKYFDLVVKHYNGNSKKPDQVTSKSRFLCTKHLIANGKKYPSYAHWKNNIDNSDKVIDSADYWKESEYFYIYEQN